MAKKAAKVGAPQKECPQCHTKVHARTAKCSACGYEFPKPAPKAAKATPASPTVDLLGALDVIDEQGGIQAVRQALAAYEKANAVVSKLGGIDKANELLDKLDQLK